MKYNLKFAESYSENAQIRILTAEIEYKDTEMLLLFVCWNWFIPIFVVLWKWWNSSILFKYGYYR